MKIAIMLRHLETQKGGIGTYTFNLLRSIFEIDTENEYILFYQHPVKSSVFANYSKIQEITIPSSSNLLWDQIAVPRRANELGIDLIFNPKLSVPIFSQCKNIFVMHGGDWFVFPQNYNLLDRIYHRIFAPLYFKKAVKVISVSKSATADILRAINVAPDKLITIYHGVADHFVPIHDIENLYRIKRKYELPDNFMLFVGQIYPMKNFGGILRAFSVLRAKTPCKLVVVGKPALKFKRELNLVSQLDLVKDVSLLGWVPDEDLPSIYNLADFLVFPSLYEGFGLPIIEAMACGCPVLTSNRGAPAEVAGDAAHLVDPTDIPSIADGMHELVMNAELRNRLKDKGFVRAQKFTWERSARKTINLFNSFNA
jgi:glycosyltransferase involved in cell wall biosynthesis